MVSFQRMKDEIDGLGNHISSRVPVIGKSGCFTMVAIGVFVLFIIGFAIGYGSHRSNTDSNNDGIIASALQLQQPNYIFLNNNTGSCPALIGDRLLTTMKEGDSFEGLVVNLACRGDYNVFPNQIKCRRKTPGDSQLEWSHIPVCYPSVLVSKTHWTKTLHARSVSCTGDASKTTCYLSCIRDYIAVESKAYSCSKHEQPCNAWTLGDAQCFICDQQCASLHQVDNPRSDALLSSLNCAGSCDRIVVNSDGPAAVWQNKRTGLFKFIGEHNGRPVYQNNATKEFLFYTTVGSEWLVGPDFRKPHAGIQIYGNDNTQCPDKSGGRNVSRLYIDSSEPSDGGTGIWTQDESLSFECYDNGYKTVKCKCKSYKVFNLVNGNSTEHESVSYLMGIYEKNR